MLKGGIRGGAADKCPRFVEAFHRPATRLVVKEGVVSNFEEPRAETTLVLITCQREISLDQSVLCQIISIVLVATAQGKQEASQCLLLTLHVRYEYFSRHRRLILFRQPFFLGLDFLSEHPLADEIIDQEGDAHSK